MSSRTQCYYWNSDNGGIRMEYPLTACGTSPAGLYRSTGVELCCGNSDACGANSMCQWGTGTHPGLGSGYYVGGCTDPTFNDPMCRKDCRHSGGGDIEYTGNGIWSCCTQTQFSDGTFGPNCSEPLSDQSYQLNWSPNDFPGPTQLAWTPPVLLNARTSDSAIMSSSTSSTANTTTVTETLAAATGSTGTTALVGLPAGVTTVPTATAASKGLSTRATAGIAVGVVVGILLIAGVAAGVLMMRKRNQRRKTIPPIPELSATRG